MYVQYKHGTMHARRGHHGRAPTTPTQANAASLSPQRSGEMPNDPHFPLAGAARRRDWPGFA